MTRSLPSQLWRFAAVGASNTAVTLAAYAAALQAGIPYLPAGAAAFGLGALNGFLLNRGWTFAHSGSLRGTGARYLAVQLIALGANLALLRIGVHVIGLAKLDAQVAATVPVTLLSFALNRVWTFHPRRATCPDAPSPAPRPVVGHRRDPHGHAGLRLRRLLAGRGRSGSQPARG